MKNFNKKAILLATGVTALSMTLMIAMGSFIKNAKKEARPTTEASLYDEQGMTDAACNAAYDSLSDKRKRDLLNQFRMAQLKSVRSSWKPEFIMSDNTLHSFDCTEHVRKKAGLEDNTPA